MINLEIWKIFGVASLILLAIYRKTKNAVWGGLTLGVIVGLIIFFIGNNSWLIIIKSMIAGIMIGFIAELLGKLSDYIKSKKYE